LVNSDLYPSSGMAKQSAMAFYLRRGFRMLTCTGPVRSFYRDLH